MDKKIPTSNNELNELGLVKLHCPVGKLPTKNTGLNDLLRLILF